jgi:hypothetical protein
VVQALGGCRLEGFYTQEVRERGQRGLLAHAGWHSQPRVGRYGVEPGRLQAIIQAELCQSPGAVDVYVIDEQRIGTTCRSNSPAFIAARAASNQERQDRNDEDDRSPADCRRVAGAGFSCQL